MEIGLASGAPSVVWRAMLSSRESIEAPSARGHADRANKRHRITLFPPCEGRGGFRART